MSQSYANDGTFVGLLIVLFLVLIGLIIYFIPTIIAFARGHVNKVPILILNLFLGWSLIGWVISLVWAFTKKE